ncbi:PTS sugar transporter subunit IIA [Sulfitobacter sp. PR48]|jgi:PTS system nitrogen regulatory IIA component|uniref:PTS sugar transporter subunit IIA n=1 Tax=Sulfitobacter porphyrae TaxID=1246864 RepID=A0ABW2AYP7_9RHOB|nr:MULTISPECIES: PTS sugar transporter subunit IIA [unclassified Sulfitobacter]MCZ4255258.1 PTS sugar transporter subunit IIA [Sulfitobacter sp. G21635-S1]MDD9719666.1 PTS sugar transporter subunit IIA [Sulfitobacter sp. PR48]GLT08653.1 PTS lactose transporter subunit IIC [Sulfitobacter porphyrae]
MELAKLLKPEAVKVVNAASSKKRLMQDLGDLVESVYGFKSGIVVDALMAREALGPTGVGHGVALPHARLDGLESVVGAFILLDRPVDFSSVDRQPVDIAFALFAPEEAGVEHLKALALVSRTLRNQTICSKLRANPDPATLYTILIEEPSVQAA